MRPLGPLKNAILLLALVLLSGCTAPGASQPPEPPRVILEPGGRVLVEQASGRVAFTFSAEETPGRGDLTPTRAVDLGVKKVGEDAGLWYVRARATESAAARIVYGIVPPGFIQDIPANGPAPKLEKGVTYSVSAGPIPSMTAIFTFRGD